MMGIRRPDKAEYWKAYREKMLEDGHLPTIQKELARLRKLQKEEKNKPSRNESGHSVLLAGYITPTHIDKALEISFERRIAELELRAADVKANRLKPPVVDVLKRRERAEERIWPFTTMRKGEVYRVETRRDWPLAVRAAHAYAWRSGTKFKCRWNKLFLSGTIERIE